MEKKRLVMVLFCDAWCKEGRRIAHEENRYQRGYVCLEGGLSFNFCVFVINGLIRTGECLHKQVKGDVTAGDLPWSKAGLVWFPAVIGPRGWKCPNGNCMGAKLIKMHTN